MIRRQMGAMPASLSRRPFAKRLQTGVAIAGRFYQHAADHALAGLFRQPVALLLGEWQIHLNLTFPHLQQIRYENGDNFGAINSPLRRRTCQ